MALQIVLVPIVSCIPPIQRLVQTIEPISRCWHVRNLIARDVLGNEARDWVADEHVSVLDVIPQVVPNVFLRTARLGNEITADLDVRAIDDRAIRCRFLDERDQARHLRVIDLSM